MLTLTSRVYCPYVLLFNCISGIYVHTTGTGKNMNVCCEVNWVLYIAQKRDYLGLNYSPPRGVLSCSQPKLFCLHVLFVNIVSKWEKHCKYKSSVLCAWLAIMYHPLICLSIVPIMEIGLNVIYHVFWPLLEGFRSPRVWASTQYKHDQCIIQDNNWVWAVHQWQNWIN